MQGRPAFFSSLRFYLYAHKWVGSRNIVQPFKQRFEVQHGAAHQHGQPPPCTNGVQACRGVAHKSGGAVAVGRVDDVYQMVRHLRQLTRRGLGRANVHAFVDQG